MARFLPHSGLVSKEPPHPEQYSWDEQSEHSGKTEWEILSSGSDFNNAVKQNGM